MTVLIDTSAWVEYFRGTTSTIADATRHQIKADESFVTCGPVWMEVAAGARSEESLRVMSSVLARGSTKAVHAHYFDSAAALYRRCRAQGVTVRSMIDCLIAVVAIDNDLEVLHHDRDFGSIAQVAPLKVHPASLV